VCCSRHRFQVEVFDLKKAAAAIAQGDLVSASETEARDRREVRR
jgi:hypothetical protein